MTRHGLTADDMPTNDGDEWWTALYQSTGYDAGEMTAAEAAAEALDVTALPEVCLDCWSLSGLGPCDRHGAA